MGGLGRWGPQGGFDHLGDALVGMLAGRPGRSSSCSLGQAQFEVAAVPLADGRVAGPQPFGDGGVGFAVGSGERDLSPLHDPVGQ